MEEDIVVRGGQEGGRRKGSNVKRMKKKKMLKLKVKQGGRKEPLLHLDGWEE